MSLTRRRLLTQNMNDMDEFILEATPDGDLTYNFVINIERNANLPIVSVQYDNINNRYVVFEENTPNTQDVEIQGVEGDAKKTFRFCGAFTNVRPVATLTAGGTTKVKILKWYGLSNKLFEGLFCGQSIDYEITIPDHIVNIDGLAFQEKGILFTSINLSSGAKLNLPQHIESISSFGQFTTTFLIMQLTMVIFGL